MTKTVVLILAGVANLTLFLGPFREVVGGNNEPCAKCGRAAAHSHWIRDWLKGWPRRPRPKLTRRDFLPNSGFMFFPPAIAVALFATSVYLVTKSSYVLAALALAGALLEAAAFIGYVRRPEETEKSGAQPTTPTRKP